MVYVLIRIRFNAQIDASEPLGCSRFGLPLGKIFRHSSEVMHLPNLRVTLATISIPALALTGCNKPSAGPDLSSEVAILKAELEAANEKLASAERNVSAQRDTLALAAETREVASKEAEVKDGVVVQKDTQVGDLEKQLNALKTGEAMVYADISSTNQRGLTAVALRRYEEFLNEFPNSPLAVDARRAVLELSPRVAAETKERVAMIDPKRPERELLARFAEGRVSLEEMGPLLKQRTGPEVIALLGPPNMTYRNGSELGYENKVIDGITGQKEALVISFESNHVSELRAGYRGKPLKP